MIREETEEEEQYMTIGEDGRPYIAERIRQRDGNKETKGARTTNPREEERNKMWDEDEVTIIEEEEEDMEDLIREYQENPRPSTETVRKLGFYGEGDWRQDKGDEIKRFIRCKVETELVNEYQKNAEPTEEVRRKLEERIGDKWREDQGVPGRNYILVLV